MKKIESQTEKFRCQSTGTSNNSSVSSILKDPSKSKHNTNRSVRFEQPEDTLNYDCIHKISEACIQQSPNSLKITSASKPPAKSHLSDRSSTLASINKKQNPDKNAIISIKSPEVLYSPIKTFKSSKFSRPPQSSSSPISKPKTLSYDFRTQDFYQKLSKFINNKPHLPKPPTKLIKKPNQSPNLINSSLLHKNLQDPPNLLSEPKNLKKFCKSLSPTKILLLNP
jgi:hypothetical protein